MKKKIVALLIITIMLLSLAPQVALAATTHIVADGETLNIETGVLTHADSTTETLTISDGDTISVDAGAVATITGSKNVMIDCGAGAALTLDGVTIDVSATEDACALSFTGSGNTLTLAGTNTLKSGENEPGVRVEVGTSLEIMDDGETGADSLEATAGDFAAGIGGGNGSSGGDITISDGDIKATGGNGKAGGDVGGAGIGGGFKGSGGNITISGDADVTAKGGDSAAGIGGGFYGGGGEITISGGTIKAYGGGGDDTTEAYYGAGIGGGEYGDGGNITISGDADVTAKGGDSAAGIGGGFYGGGGEITISGDANVTAKGGGDAAGIGGGDDGDGGEITISGDAGVTAVGGDSAAGIGGGDDGNGGEITISGDADVTAKGGKNAAGIGSGDGDEDSNGINGGTIEISGGTIKAYGGGCDDTTEGDSGAGIGGGDYGDGGEITISGDADVTAKGGYYAAGIGGGDYGSGGIITISENADVTAKGGKSAAGIGSGYYPDNSNADTKITITGGTVTAYGGGGDDSTAGEYGAGIGGGKYGSGGSGGGGGTVDISGGIVYAIKDAGGTYDIGQGTVGSAGTISISDTAAVLLGTDTISPSPPATTSHTHYDFSAGTQDANGIAVPAEWESAFGAYLVLCDLSYSKNGGEGSLPSPVTDMAAGVSVTVADGSDLNKDGFSFDGWNTVENGIGGTAYAPGDTLTLTADTTLYAQWEPLVYTLSYNANGGYGTPPLSQEGLKGDAIVVQSSGVLNNPGHEFDGWKDGSGTPYMPGDTLTFSEDTTLYAQWALNLTIDTPNLFAGTLGEGYSCSLAASGGEGDMTWYASGLPKGLGMERDTGKISGKPNETGDFSVKVTVYDEESRKAERTYSLTVYTPSATGKYGITPDADSAYTVGTADGFTALTIKSGVTGLRLINAAINPVITHEGTEFVVFTHTRDGVQIGYSFNKADFDVTDTAGAAFNVQPGDVIMIYVVDELSNDAGKNPVLLQ